MSVNKQPWYHIKWPSVETSFNSFFLYKEKWSMLQGLISGSALAIFNLSFPHQPLTMIKFPDAIQIPLLNLARLIWDLYQSFIIFDEYK